MADADYNVKAIISAQTSQFEKGMKNAQSSVNSLSSSISNITNLVKKAFAFTGVAMGTKALADFGKTAVKSGNQATKTLMILDNTVKATGADAWTTTKELEAMAKSLSDETDYSVTELEKMQSVLLGFREITGKNFEEASEAILDMATVMGMDLTSAVQTVGKALDDPIKGLDSLRRQGFAFTNEQKAELAQLVRNGEKMKAQKIILDELSKSYGGASKAGQDSFAKQRHAIENFQDTLGTKLLPIVKLFAQENATAFNSLSKMVEEMDFNKIGAVVKVSFDTLKNLSGELVSNFKSIGISLKDAFVGIDFKPVVSTLDSLLGIITKIGGSVGSKFEAVAESMSKLKDSLANMTASIDFEKLETAINTVISAIIFLRGEVLKVLDNLKENIKTFVLNVWNSIKSLFEAGNEALANSETDIKSWGDFFYEQFNNVFKIAQDMIQSVSAILKGDWKVAWEYAKLTVLRMVDGLLDAISTLLNAFPDMVNKFIAEWNKFLGFINKGRKKIGMEEIELVPEFKHVDLSGITGVQNKIEEVEKNISDLTGAKADKNLKDLDKFVAGTSGLLGKFADNFKEATDKAKKELDDLSGNFKVTPSPSQVKDDLDDTFKIVTEWDSKLLQQRLEYLEEHGKDYTDEYHEIQLDLIKTERDREIQSANSAGASAEEIAKINEYYNHEIETENDRFEKVKRNKAFETVKIVASALKTIAKTTIDVFKKVASTIKDVFTKVVNVVKNIFSNIFNFSKQLISSVTGVLEKLFEFDPDEFLNNLLKIEDSILTFFIITLPNLPGTFESAFESVIVTIKTLLNSIDWEGLSQTIKNLVNAFTENIPQIVNGILLLFSTLIENIANSLSEKAPQIVKAIGDIFQTIVKTLPSMFASIGNLLESFINSIGSYLKENQSEISNLFKNLFSSIGETVKSIGDTLKENIPYIISTLGDLFLNITETLPTIIETLIGTVGSLLSELGKYLTANKERFENALKNIISSIINGINDFIKTGGWKNLLQGLLAIQQAIENAVTDNIEEIGNTIVSLLPDLMEFLKSSIISASKTLAKIAPTLIKIIVEIIATILQVAFDPDVIESSFDVIENVIAGLIQGIITLIAKLIPVAIKLILNFPKMLAGLVEAIVTGIIRGFIEVDWIQVIVDIFTGFVDAFKDFFGIHSPSTLFEGFGTNMVEGLVIGLKGISESVMIILQPFFDLIESVISNILDGIAQISKISFTGLNEGLQTVTGSLNESLKIIINGLNNLVNAMIGSLNIGLNIITNNLNTGLNIITNNLNTGLKTVTDALTKITSVSFTGLNEGLRTVGSSLNTLTETSITGLNEGLKNVLSGLESITKISFTGLNEGLQTVTDALTEITSVSFTGVNTGLKNVLGFLTDISKVSFNGLNKGLEVTFTGLAKITDSITGLVKALTELVKVIGEISGISGLGGNELFSSLGFTDGKLNLTELLDPMGNVSKTIDVWKDDDKSVSEKIGETALNIVDPTGLVDVVSGDGDFWEKTGEVVARIFDPLNIFNWWATGTNSAPKGLSIVGEAGPELVNFRGGEQVLNSHNTQKALEGMGGTTINQNVTFNNLQDTTAFAMLQQLKQYNRQMAINGVL